MGSLHTELMCFWPKKFDQILSNNYPHIKRLTFVQKLLENLIIITLKVTKSQTNSFLINRLQIAQGILWRCLLLTCFFQEKVKLSLFNISFIFEKSCHIRYVFKECWSHKGFLTVYTGYLGYFVNKIKDWRRNGDYLYAHYLEKLSKYLTSFKDKVDWSYLWFTVFIHLIQHEFFHFNIVILTEKLKETECTAESHLVIQLGLYFKFISFMAKHFYQNIFFTIEIVIRINNLVREISLLFILFELSHLNQKRSNVFNQLLQTNKSRICCISNHLFQNRILTVSVTIIEINNSQKQSLI